MNRKILLIVLGFIFFQFAALIHGAIPASERVVLIALYNSTNGDNWANKSGWKTPPLHTDGFAIPETEGSWYGVTVVSDYVSEIRFIDNHLTGSIPSQLGNLTNLTCLALGNNQLSGSIPYQIGNLNKLSWLILNNNQLNGEIPLSLIN